MTSTRFSGAPFDRMEVEMETTPERIFVDDGLVHTLSGDGHGGVGATIVDSYPYHLYAAITPGGGLDGVILLYASGGKLSPEAEGVRFLGQGFYARTDRVFEGATVYEWKPANT